MRFITHNLHNRILISAPANLCVTMTFPCWRKCVAHVAPGYRGYLLPAGRRCRWLSSHGAGCEHLMLQIFTLGAADKQVLFLSSSSYPIERIYSCRGMVGFWFWFVVCGLWFRLEVWSDYHSTSWVQTSNLVHVWIGSEVETGWYERCHNMI